MLRQKGLPEVLRWLLHPPRGRRRSHHSRGRGRHIPVPLLVLLVLHLQTLVFDLVFFFMFHPQQRSTKKAQENEKVYAKAHGK